MDKFNHFITVFFLLMVPLNIFCSLRERNNWREQRKIWEEEKEKRDYLNQKFDCQRLNLTFMHERSRAKLIALRNEIEEFIKKIEKEDSCLADDMRHYLSIDVFSEAERLYLFHTSQTNYEKINERCQRWLDAVVLPDLPGTSQ